MVNRSVGRTTHITAQMKFVVPLLIALLTLIAGCWPWANGEYEFHLGDTVKVVDTETDGLRVRSTPAGAVIALVPNNWVFQISNATPESATLNGVTYLWWYVIDAQYESSPTSGWVAEGYLTKVASNSLTPSTVPAYFTASTGQIDSVVEKALQEVKDDSLWYDHARNVGLCLGFVRHVFDGDRLGWESARAALNALEGRGLFHPADECWNPPTGALVFFESNRNPDYDHVGVCVGSRQVAHAEGRARIRDLNYIVQLDYIDSYAGWAYPPEEWCEGTLPISGLVGWWKFDEGSGTVAHDSSENGNNGEIHGATFAAGVSGSGLEFDGENDYVDLGNDASLYATSMTLVEWFKFTVSPTDYWMTINDYNASNGDWGMNITVHENGGVGGHIGAGSNNHFLGALYSDPPTGRGLNDGEWHLVVSTYSDASKVIKLYVDANLVAENNRIRDFTAADSLTHNPSLCKWYIGVHSQYFVYPAIGSHYYRGLIDEVRIYNRALTQEEVTAIYDQTKP